MKSLNRKIKALLVLLTFAAYMPASFAEINMNNPVLDSSINGGYVGWHDGDKGSNKFDIGVNAPQGGVAQFDWKSFNVGQGITVDWIFKHHNSTAINRVLAGGGMSQILGTLTSSCANGCGSEKTGNVILINPNGIFFGNNAQVNLNSFTASTYDINGMKNIRDAVKDGTYANLTKDANNANNWISYNPTGQKDKYGLNVTENDINAKFKYGTTITYSAAANAINGLGEGTLDGITINGAKFNAQYDKNGQPTTTAVGVNFISNKIDVDNATIQTFIPHKNADGSFDTSGNINASNGYTRSGVKMLTGSSVDLKYDVDGAAYGATTYLKNVAAGQAKDHGISIKNSLISTGTAQIINGTTNTDLVIDNSILSTNKVADWVEGKAALYSARDIIIKDSRIDTLAADNGETTNKYNYDYGSIEANAERNIIIEDSRLTTADSLLNWKDGVVGNITLNAGNGVRISQNKVNNNKKGPNGEVYTNGIVAAGNLNIKSGLTDIVIEGTNKSWLSGKKDVNINSARNLTIEDTNVQGRKIDLVAGKVNENANVADNDGKGGAVGSIIVKNSILNASTGEAYPKNRTLNMFGLNTIIIDSLLAYDELNFYNNTTQDLGNLNNVLLKDKTTVFDRLLYSGKKDTLALETNGMLVIDNNKLQGKNEVTGAISNPANILLKSTNSLVSIRNNSDITTGGNLTIDAATNASVSTSKINAGKNIEINAGGAVAIGDVIEHHPGYENETITKKGSELIANNGTITLNAKGTKGNLEGIAIRGGSKLTSKANTATADKGNIYIQDNSKVTATEGNNVITSKEGKVFIQGKGTLVKSNTADVIINQDKTALLDTEYTGKVEAAKNIKVNVKGNNQNIEGSSLDQFKYGDRLGLDAANKIALSKETGDWTLSKVDFNSKENTITAKNGNVTINNDIALGDKTNKTTIKAGNNVKTNGLIKANSKKLIVNAGNDIDITFTGVDNKLAGLEINSDVNTKGTGDKEQNKNNTNLIGKDVKLTAQDGSMTISKIKADTLTTNGKIFGATDNAPNANTDNVGSTAGMANQGTAYIEVRTKGGWNQDTNVDDIDSMPDFYKENYDGIDTRNEEEGVIITNSQRHKLLMDGDNNNILLVYERTTGECDIPVDPEPTPDPVGPGISYNDLTDSTVVRLPRHEEGVSAVAPVLNEITDPTANVIMAAARLTLDEENESDNDDELGAY